MSKHSSVNYKIRDESTRERKIEQIKIAHQNYAVNEEAKKHLHKAGLAAMHFTPNAVRDRQGKFM